MAFNYLWVVALLLFLAACIKRACIQEDINSTPQTNVEVENQIRESLLEQEELSLFLKAFEELESPTEMEEDTNFAPGSKGSRLTQGELKDHIIKKDVYFILGPLSGDFLPTITQKPTAGLN